VLRSIVGAVGTRLQSSKKAVCVMCIPNRIPYTVTICCYGHRMGQIFQWGTTYLTLRVHCPLTPDKRNLFLVNKYSVAAYQGYPMGFMVLYTDKKEN
jgi:hypothetical protein